MEAKFTALFAECEEADTWLTLRRCLGVNTQGETSEEAKLNLEEAFKLVVQTQVLYRKMN